MILSRQSKSHSSLRYRVEKGTISALRPSSCQNTLLREQAEPFLMSLKVCAGGRRSALSLPDWISREHQPQIPSPAPCREGNMSVTSAVFSTSHPCASPSFLGLKAPRLAGPLASHWFPVSETSWSCLGKAEQSRRGGHGSACVSPCACTEMTLLKSKVTMIVVPHRLVRWKMLLFALDVLPRSTFIETGSPNIIRLANGDVTHADSDLFFLVMISGVSAPMRASWLSAAELLKLVTRAWGWSKGTLLWLCTMQGFLPWALR